MCISTQSIVHLREMKLECTSISHHILASHYICGSSSLQTITGVIPPPPLPHPSLISVHPHGNQVSQAISTICCPANGWSVSVMSSSWCCSGKHESPLAAQNWVVVVMIDVPFMLLSFCRHSVHVLASWSQICTQNTI